MNRVDTAVAIVCEHVAFLAKPRNFEAYYNTVLSNADLEIRPRLAELAAADPTATARTLAGRFLSSDKVPVEVEPSHCAICGGPFHGRGMICPARLADKDLAKTVQNLIQGV